MNTRPILFSTEMVKALMEGRKKMTRRIKGLEFFNDAIDRPIDDDHPGRWFYAGMKDGIAHMECMDTFESYEIKCPYGDVGDVLWIRESCMWVMKDNCHELLEGRRENTQYVYKASESKEWFNYAKEKYRYKWTPSIHMPKSACRTWLRITDIRVERLQEISEQDAVDEGIEWLSGMTLWWKNYLNDPLPGVNSPIESFKSLWVSINGAGSWDANPWVWVVSFEECGMPEGFI